MKLGVPTLQVDGSGLNVAIVASSWHTTVMDGLIEGARRGLAEAGVSSVTLVRVPGAFELPVACSRLALSYDAMVGLGVLTCDDDEQALDRAGLEGSSEDKGHQAATAAVATVSSLRDLKA